jgi:hypothetical protein
MSTITFAYCWKPQPGQEWQAHEKTSGIVVFAATQAEAVAEFNKVWDFRAPVEWVYASPPLPKRPEPGIEVHPEDRSRGALAYKELMKRFHSDVNPNKTYTADEVTAAINQLWLAMKGPK